MILILIIHICLEVSFDDFSSFFSPIKPSTSTSSTLDRLQSLADSLPNQIYDKNGNLIPLNSQNPPMSFFEMDNTLGKTSLAESVKTVPIFEREGVDWSKVTLTSILKKIVPEETFLESEENQCEIIEAKNNTSDMSQTATSPIINNVRFTMGELKLLDKEQLHSLAKHFGIKPTTIQTDHKIEQEILAACNEPYKRIIKKGTVSKDKISWTEENETLLVKLYDELRAEKHKADQKLHSLLSLTSANTSTNSLKRCKGSSERGLWAVLSDQMRLASKFHVSVSECRNKLIILKRLKPQ